jgi:hypothetical protein
MNTEKLAFPFRAITTRARAEGRGKKEHLYRPLPRQFRRDGLNCGHITNPITNCGRLLIPRSEVESFLARKVEHKVAP